MANSPSLLSLRGCPRDRSGGAAARLSEGLLGRGPATPGPGNGAAKIHCTCSEALSSSPPPLPVAPGSASARVRPPGAAFPGRKQSFGGPAVSGERPPGALKAKKKTQAGGGQQPRRLQGRQLPARQKCPPEGPLGAGEGPLGPAAPRPFQAGKLPRSLRSLARLRLRSYYAHFPKSRPH